MGIFNIIGRISSSAIKIAVAPIVIASDAISVSTGGDTKNTKELFESIEQDAKDIIDDLTGENN